MLQLELASLLCALCLRVSRQTAVVVHATFLCTCKSQRRQQADTGPLCADYCEALPDAAASDRCWQAYNFFESKKREAEGSCSVEESSGVAGGSGAALATEAVQALLRLEGVCKYDAQLQLGNSVQGVSYQGQTQWACAVTLLASF